MSSKQSELRIVLRSNLCWFFCTAKVHTVCTVAGCFDSFSGKLPWNDTQAGYACPTTTLPLGGRQSCFPQLSKHPPVSSVHDFDFLFWSLESKMKWTIWWLNSLFFSFNFLYLFDFKESNASTNTLLLAYSSTLSPKMHAIRWIKHFKKT